jgi:glycosyltransferase involved in cell wall biosynthesis
MRILQIAPLWESVPPPAYGGTEAVVSLLTEELVRRGHEVTLVASGDSVTTASLASVFPRSLRRATDLGDRGPYDWMHAAEAIRLASDFDIVHNHAGELPMAMSRLTLTPMLTTMHCLATPDTQFIWDRYEGAYNTISRSQHQLMQPIEGPAVYVGHVYNGIDVASFPFQAQKGDDLLFLSRIAPEKGAHLAIEVARKCGRRLIMAGKVDRYDQDYFDEVVRDLIDGDQIVFYGEADALQKRELYAKARCLLLPLQWDEPFGLVMPEAMACGTPVVAMRRGSAPEIVEHGRTGFVVDTVDELVEAVAALDEIEAEDCRKHVAAEFAPEAMTEAYLEMYARVIAASAAAAIAPPPVPAPSGDREDDIGEPLAVA